MVGDRVYYRKHMARRVHMRAMVLLDLFIARYTKDEHMIVSCLEKLLGRRE